MNIFWLFSMVDSALPGTSQLIDCNVCCVQLLRSLSHCSILGLLAASRSLLANRRVIVSPLIVRLAWDEHGRWALNVTSENMPQRYNQWALADRLVITLFCT
jgi:hypothetical protein